MAEDGDGDDPGGTNYLRVLTRSRRIVDLAQVIEPLDLHYWAPEDFPDPGHGRERDGRSALVTGRLPALHQRAVSGRHLRIEGPWHKLS